jgi:hypothetical protein
MTSPQACLNPARGNDRGAVLRAFQLVAGDGMQLVEVVGAEIRNCVTFEHADRYSTGLSSGQYGGRKVI